MPFKSEAQRRLMYAVENEPGVAKKTGVPKSVAEKFIAHKNDSVDKAEILLKKIEELLTRFEGK